MLNHYKVVLVFIALSFASSMALSKTPEPHTEYTVKRHQWLAEILRQMNYKPLWGPTGYVEKTLELNPDLFKNDGSLIFPSTKIKLPTRHSVGSSKRDLASYQLPELSTPTKTMNINIDCRGATNGSPPTQFPADQIKVAGVTINLNVYCGTQAKDDNGLWGQLVDIGQEVTFSASLGYSIFDLQDQTTGANASIASEPGFLAGFLWQRSWDENLDMFIQADWQWTEYSDSNVYTITETSTNNMNLGLGIAYKINSAWSLRGGAFYEQKHFFRTLGGTEFFAHTIARPVLSASLERKLKLLAVPWTLSLQAKYLSTASKENIRLSSGSEIGLDLRTHLQLEEGRLSPFITYSRGSQDSPQLKHQFEFLNLGISYEY